MSANGSKLTLKDLGTTNPFGVLGAKSTMSLEEVKNCYKQKAKQYHPDNMETGNADKFKMVQRCWEYVEANFDVLHKDNDNGFGINGSYNAWSSVNKGFSEGSVSAKYIAEFNKVKWTYPSEILGVFEDVLGKLIANGVVYAVELTGVQLSVLTVLNGISVVGYERYLENGKVDKMLFLKSIARGWVTPELAVGGVYSLYERYLRSCHKEFYNANGSIKYFKQYKFIEPVLPSWVNGMIYEIANWFSSGGDISNYSGKFSSVAGRLGIKQGDEIGDIIDRVCSIFNTMIYCGDGSELCRSKKANVGIDMLGYLKGIAWDGVPLVLRSYASGGKLIGYDRLIEDEMGSYAKVAIKYAKSVGIVISPKEGYIDPVALAYCYVRGNSGGSNGKGISKFSWSRSRKKDLGQKYSDYVNSILDEQLGR